MTTSRLNQLLTEASAENQPPNHLPVSNTVFPDKERVALHRTVSRILSEWSAKTLNLNESELNKLKDNLRAILNNSSAKEYRVLHPYFTQYNEKEVMDEIKYAINVFQPITNMGNNQKVIHTICRRTFSGFIKNKTDFHVAKEFLSNVKKGAHKHINPLIAQFGLETILKECAYAIQDFIAKKEFQSKQKKLSAPGTNIEKDKSSLVSGKNKIKQFSSTQNQKLRDTVVKMLSEQICGQDMDDDLLNQIKENVRQLVNKPNKRLEKFFNKENANVEALKKEALDVIENYKPRSMRDGLAISQIAGEPNADIDLFQDTLHPTKRNAEEHANQPPNKKQSLLVFFTPEPQSEYEEPKRSNIYDLLNK